MINVTGKTRITATDEISKDGKHYTRYNASISKKNYNEDSFSYANFPISFTKKALEGKELKVNFRHDIEIKSAGLDFYKFQNKEGKTIALFSIIVFDFDLIDSKEIKK